MRRCSQVNAVHKNIGHAPLQLSVNVWEWERHFLTAVGKLLNRERVLGGGATGWNNSLIHWLHFTHICCMLNCFPAIQWWTLWISLGYSRYGQFGSFFDRLRTPISKKRAGTDLTVTQCCRLFLWPWQTNKTTALSCVNFSILLATSSQKINIGRKLYVGFPG